MKIILIVFSIFVATFNTYAQQSSLNTEYASYIKKSKKQNTTAWIMVGGGVAVMASPILIPYNVHHDYGYRKRFNARPVLFFTGLSTVISSIPFFLSASKNRQNAEDLQASIKWQTSSAAIPGQETPYPSLSLSFKL